jgi:hypothetical protein
MTCHLSVDATRNTTYDVRLDGHGEQLAAPDTVGCTATGYGADGAIGGG